MKKQYIKAVDVIAEVLRKWYILVICVILMAVAVPNFKYNNDKKLAESNKKLIEQMKEKDDAADDPDNDIDYPDEYYQVQNQIDEWKSYLEKSAFMKLDPYNMVAVRLTYEIDDYNVALPAYIAYINKKSMAQDIGNTLENYTTVDIQDLVSCEILGSTEDSKILSVNIYASNKDEGDTISSAVKKAISDYGEIKGLSMPNLMDEVCYGGMFTGVYDTQAANESRTSALVTKRDSYVPKKTDTTEASSQTSDATVDISKLVTEAHFNKAYIFIGAFLGVILAVVINIIIICVSDKIRNDSAINESFGLDYFGRINKDKISKWSKFVDRLCYRRYSQENILVSALRIAKICDNTDVKKIYLTGHISNADENIKALVDELKKQEIEAVWIDSFSQDTDSLKCIIENGNVVFINELRKAYFGDVVQDITVANEQNISILGYVTVGA